MRTMNPIENFPQWCGSFAKWFAIVMFVGLAAMAQANPKEKVLVNFNGQNGYQPNRSGLTFDSAGNLYGVTAGGGIDNPRCQSGCGVVYELSPTADGVKESVLYEFCELENCADGATPWSSVIFDSSGNLYGTTVYGGAGEPSCGGFGCGTVYELSPTANGWKETLLYSFCSMNSCLDGGNPFAGVTFDSAGNLYGTGTYTGISYGGGVVYRLTPNFGGAWTYSVLYEFDSPAEGLNPYGGVVLDSLGNVFGTTIFGGIGCSQGCGVMFELTPTQEGYWHEKVIHNFSGGIDGSYPQSGLAIDGAGTIYGEAGGGAKGGGVVFSFAPNPSGGWESHVLHSFCSPPNCADGSDPFGIPAFDTEGNLYGATTEGGADNAGGVFELIPTATGPWKELFLSLNGENGADPSGGVTLDQAGNVYGNTTRGGLDGDGVVFQITP